MIEKWEEREDNGGKLLKIGERIEKEKEIGILRDNDLLVVMLVLDIEEENLKNVLKRKKKVGEEILIDEKRNMDMDGMNKRNK